MGGKIDRTLKNELSAFSTPEPAQTYLDKTVKLCHEAFQSRRQMRRLSSFDMIVSQFRFIAKPIWALQIAVIICMCLMLHLASGSDNAATYIPAFLSLSSIFIAMTMLPFYGRSRKYKMREIESTTRLSHARLISAKLCVVGSGDVVCLIVLSLLFIGRITEAANTMLFFIALPFLLTCTGILLILNRTKEDYGVFVALGFGVGLAVTYWMLPTKIGGMLVRLGSASVGIACAALLLVLIFECRRLLRQMPSSDLQEVLIY